MTEGSVVALAWALGIIGVAFAIAWANRGQWDADAKVKIARIEYGEEDYDEGDDEEEEDNDP